MKLLLYRLMESLVATLHRATVGCGARASRIALALVLACVLSLAASAAFAAGPPLAAVDRTYAAANDVTWQELGRDENDSMPIGNGDVAANVWTEQNGDLVLLVAKSDAWTEIGQLVRLGRVRIQLSPNPFACASEFRQTLHLADGSVELASGANHLRIWVDANHPVLHVEANLAHPAVLRASLELWRTSHPYADPSPSKGGLFEFSSHNIPVDFEADTVLPATANRVEWFHFNQQSIYPFILTHEHLEVLLAKYPDPLLHLCFGAMLSGSGLKSAGDHSLQSSAPSRNLRLDLVALTTPQAASPQAWQAGMDALTRQVNTLPIEAARAAHRAWWRAFWNRSWIHVTGTPDAEKVSQGYILQRYMLAASSRGAYPAKFNGSLFTVGRDLPADAVSSNALHDPDYRAWGNSYWNQNNRLLYWPFIATGDFDLLRPWFAMYGNALLLAQDRTRLYFHHPGAEFIETMNFWGLPNLSDFGWDNPGNEVQSRYMRYHIQGALEVVAQMLDECEITRDSAFARTQLVPLADAVAAFYANHWPRGAEGELRFSPAQAIETYQVDAVNPTPDIAALRNVLPRLIDLPVAAATPAQRAAWKQTLSDLPPIPTGRTAAGKLPPARQGRPRRYTRHSPRRTLRPHEEHGESGALPGLSLSPLCRGQARPYAGPQHLRRAALSAGHMLGPGRARGCIAGPDRHCAESVRRCFHRLRQPALRLVLAFRPRLDSRPRQRRRRHEYPPVDAAPNRWTAHPAAAGLATRVDSGL